MEKAPTRKLRASTSLAAVLIGVDVFALTLTAPALPHLIQSLVAGDTTNAVRFLAILSTVFAAAQFLLLPALGSLADRYGRRPLLIISNLGLAFDCLIMATVSTLPLFLIARLISGLTFSTVPIAQAYVADITSSNERASAFGTLGAAFAVGSVLGPAIGGLLGDIDLRLPFLASAVLALACSSYAYFVLPESLAKEKRLNHSDWSHANPIGAVLFIYRQPRIHELLSNLVYGTS